MFNGDGPHVDMFAGGTGAKRWQMNGQAAVRDVSNPGYGAEP